MSREMQPTLFKTQVSCLRRKFFLRFYVILINDPTDHKPSEPSRVGKDDSMDIDKDDFPSEQANGDTGEDTALQLPPEVQTIAGASELTAPARKLSENRKEPVQSAITVPQEVADSQNSAFSEFFDETTDRISGTRFLMILQTGEQRAIFSKQGITISIPKDALPEGIQNEDQIEVIIQKDMDGGFSFSFSINGTVLNSLPDRTSKVIGALSGIRLGILS